MPFERSNYVEGYFTRKIRHQGTGNWQLSKRAETKNRILGYLQKIDSSAIDDSSRSIRSIHQKTGIERKTLSKVLSELKSENKILEIKGKKRRRLFSIQNENNKERIKDQSDQSLISRTIKKFDLTKEEGVAEIIKKVLQEGGKAYKKFIEEDTSKLKAITHVLDCYLMSIMNNGRTREYLEEFEFAKAISDICHHQLEMGKSMIDGRVKLLPEMRSFFCALSSQTSGRDVAKHYLPKIVQKFVISKERIDKINEVRSHSDLIKFIQEDPWNWGYLDMRCPNCKMYALKTHVDLNDDKCYLICKNYDAHEIGKEPHFSLSLYRQWLQDLESNKNRIAERFLEGFGISV